MGMPVDTTDTQKFLNAIFSLTMLVGDLSEGREIDTISTKSAERDRSPAWLVKDSINEVWCGVVAVGEDKAVQVYKDWTRLAGIKVGNIETEMVIW